MLIIAKDMAASMPVQDSARCFVKARSAIVYSCRDYTLFEPSEGSRYIPAVRASILYPDGRDCLGVLIPTDGLDSVMAVIQEVTDQT